MNLSVLSLALCVGLASSLQLGAADPPSKDPCLNAPNTYEIRDCYKKRMEGADKELKAIYKELIKEYETPPRDLDPSDQMYKDLMAWNQIQKKALINSQETWKRYREAQAGFVQSIYTSGTGGPVAYDQCYLEITLRRVEELKSCRGGS